MDFKKTICLLVLFFVITNAMFSNNRKQANRRKQQYRRFQQTQTEHIENGQKNFSFFVNKLFIEK